MDHVKWERYGALAGLVFVVLVVIAAFIAGTPPRPTDTPRKIHEFYRDHERALKAGAFLSGLGAVAFLWFLVSLWSRLREHRLAMMAVAGGVATIGFALVNAAITSTTALRIGDLAPKQAKFFYSLQGVVITMASFSIAALVAATSIAALRARVFPAWLGWGERSPRVGVVGGRPRRRKRAHRLVLLWLRDLRGVAGLGPGDQLLPASTATAGGIKAEIRMRKVTQVRHDRRFPDENAQSSRSVSWATPSRCRRSRDAPGVKSSKVVCCETGR